MASKMAEFMLLSLPTSVLCIWETSATMNPRTKLPFKNIHLTSSTRKINLQNAGKLIIFKENPGTTAMVTVQFNTAFYARLLKCSCLAITGLYKISAAWKMKNPKATFCSSTYCFLSHLGNRRDCQELSLIKTLRKAED